VVPKQLGSSDLYQAGKTQKDGKYFQMERKIQPETYQAGYERYQDGCIINVYKSCHHIRLSPGAQPRSGGGNPPPGGGQVSAGGQGRPVSA
jgi:hypothetical protein